MESYHPPLGNYNQGTQTTTDHKLILHYNHLPTCLSEYQEMAYLFEIQPPKGALLLVINQFNLRNLTFGIPHSISCNTKYTSSHRMICSRHIASGMINLKQRKSYTEEINHCIVTHMGFELDRAWLYKLAIPWDVLSNVPLQTPPSIIYAVIMHAIWISDTEITG